MTTYANLGAKLLRDAATFFRNIGEQNPPLKEQMNDNADVYEQVADLIEQDPLGELNFDDSSEEGTKVGEINLNGPFQF